MEKEVNMKGNGNEEIRMEPVMLLNIIGGPLPNKSNLIFPVKNQQIFWDYTGMFVKMTFVSN